MAGDTKDQENGEFRVFSGYSCRGWGPPGLKPFLRRATRWESGGMRGGRWLRAGLRSWKGLPCVGKRRTDARGGKAPPGDRHNLAQPTETKAIGSK